jgi:hypothetical protein
MTDYASSKWNTCATDVQIVLRIAFLQALTKPQLAAEYTEWAVWHRRFFLQFYRFRIGYATFVLMYLDIIDEYIIVDFDFDDGDGLLPEPHRPAAHAN